MVTRPGAGEAAASRSLTDRQGRTLDYLRFAVTDRCNLRCRYCMPAGGIATVPRDEILAFEEAERLCRVFCDLGVRRIRITGGEPLVRRGVVRFMARLSALDARPEILLTTNGVLLVEHLDALRAAGLRRINLSLDSLDPATWSRITRRDRFAAVRGAIDAVLSRGMGLKINTVVLAGINDHELTDFVALTRALPVAVRFGESMSFDGRGGRLGRHLSGQEILARLKSRYRLVPDEAASMGVARMFRVPGHAGTVGVIEGHSRSFCGSCTRLRLDSRGRLRTCLYGPLRVDLRELLRDGAGDDELAAAIRAAVAGRAADGHAAERELVDPTLASMSSIGG